MRTFRSLRGRGKGKRAYTDDGADASDSKRAKRDEGDEPDNHWDKLPEDAQKHVSSFVGDTERRELSIVPLIPTRDWKLGGILVPPVGTVVRISPNYLKLSDSSKDPDALRRGPPRGQDAYNNDGSTRPAPWEESGFTYVYKKPESAWGWDDMRTITIPGMDYPTWTPGEGWDTGVRENLDAYYASLDEAEEYAVFGGTWVVMGYTNEDSRVTLKATNTPATAGEYTITPRPWQVTIDTWIHKMFQDKPPLKPRAAS